MKGARDSVNKDISCFGTHPQVLLSRGQLVHLIGRYILTPAAPSGIVNSAIGMANVPEEQGIGLRFSQGRSVHDKPETSLSGKKRPGLFA